MKLSLQLGYNQNLKMIYCYYETLIYLTKNLLANTNPTETANNYFSLYQKNKKNGCCLIPILFKLLQEPYRAIPLLLFHLEASHLASY